LFGPRKYRYKLEMDDEAFDILYKERNFNIEVKLTDSSGQPIRNGKCQNYLANLVPLCIGAATTNSEWIS
jgi:hypothetical protein